MIISPAQLKAINEAELRVTANSAGGSDLLNAATNANAGQNNQGVKIVVPGNTGKEYSTTLPDLQKGKSNIPQDASSVYLEPSEGANNALGESRYSKRQVELGRMLEMRRTGKVYSKKQLNEMFFECGDNAIEVEDIKNRIKKCKLYDIFSAANNLSDDGEERLKQAFMSGADLDMVLGELLSQADEEGLEDFCEELGI